MEVDLPPLVAIRPTPVAVAVQVSRSTNPSQGTGAAVSLNLGLGLGRAAERHNLQRKRYVCNICGKYYLNNSNLHRHKRYEHGSTAQDPIKAVCKHCGNSFKRNYLLPHERNCQKSSANPSKRRQCCSVTGCTVSFYHKEQLIIHLRDVHGEKMEPMRTFQFESMEDFRLWKAEEEERTFSFYPKPCGTKGISQVFYCQREGSLTPHRRRDVLPIKVSRKNLKGRIKTGAACTSFMRAKTNGDTVTVYYWPSHNHPISADDVKHQPVSRTTIQFIKEQIKLNVPFKLIQEAVKKRIEESGLGNYRDKNITLKRIYNLARKLREQGQWTGTDGADQLDGYVNAFLSMENSPVILYKPLDEVDVSNQSHEVENLTFIGIQTEDQQRMLQRDITMPLFIGVSPNADVFNSYLITIAVPSESNLEYPVGHLITSHLNEEAICLFFQAIGERCPDLNVNCIVSEDWPEVNAAIRRVFGEDGPYFLSKWHFLKKTWRIIRNSVPKRLVEEIDDLVLGMVDAETEERLLLLYNTYQDKFGESYPEVTATLQDAIVRAPLWATCYRHGTGIIDSSLYVDCFFAKLKKLYKKKKPSKPRHLLLELLLEMQEQYSSEREEITTYTSEELSVEHQHRLAPSIPGHFLTGTSLNHWEFLTATKDLVFYIMQCAEECQVPECKLKCADCVGLCSHLYFCTCGHGRELCKHVHRIHMEKFASGPIEYIVDEESKPGIKKQDNTMALINSEGAEDSEDDTGSIEHYEDNSDIEEDRKEIIVSLHEERKSSSSANVLVPIDNSSNLLRESSTVVISVNGSESGDATADQTEATEFSICEQYKASITENLETLRALTELRRLPESELEVINSTLCNLITQIEEGQSG